MNKIRKRHVTLIEMMIVMFLIAMIIGVVAYNYKGTLDEGKAFKTKTGIEKLTTIISLELSDPNSNYTVSDWEKIIEGSYLIQNANDLKKDGWGEVYKVGQSNDGQIEVKSDKYDLYLSKNPNTKFR